MPGVTIGEGALVGANALVNRNLEPWGIYFGNPVKKIGEREKPTEERRKIVEQLDWTKALLIYGQSDNKERRRLSGSERSVLR